MDPLLKLLEDHPLINPNNNEGTRSSNEHEMFHYSYGTAGFRYKAELMEGIVVRVGICCALLLVKQQQQQQCSDNEQLKTGNMGIMLTASHNDESYNGVKISNPDGSMINETQESFLVDFVNQRNNNNNINNNNNNNININQWKDMINKEVEDYNNASSSSTTTPPSSLLLFHIGRDTRVHSPKLSQLLIDSCTYMMELLNNNSTAQYYKLQVMNHGILTTPMLHHIVLHSNPKILPKLLYPPKPSRSGYNEWLSDAYSELMKDILVVDNDNDSDDSTTPLLLPKLKIDCACGVGYDAVKQVNDEIKSKFGGGRIERLIAYNGPKDGPLNTDCGSEHVQKQLHLPTFYKESGEGVNGDNIIEYGCSLDGDADRIVFFATSGGGDEELILLDGDKIAILIANFFNKLPKLPDTIKIGVVQTAYANGASTDYLRNTLKMPVIITKTGVKHLHHASVENFDIGIYFEANGHGTVIFGPKFHEYIEENDPQGTGMWSKVAKLINPAVGDALSDLLLVDAILHYEKFMNDPLMKHWNLLYEDLPSRQLKVAVKDRSLVKCNDNETRCLEPQSLQPALDELMSCGGPKYRCFVRASGTENVVRVYAEAPTRSEADKLANDTVRLVQEHCNGPSPSKL